MTEDEQILAIIKLSSLIGTVVTFQLDAQVLMRCSMRSSGIRPHRLEIFRTEMRDENLIPKALDLLIGSANSLMFIEEKEGNSMLKLVAELSNALSNLPKKNPAPGGKNPEGSTL